MPFCEEDPQPNKDLLGEEQSWEKEVAVMLQM